MTLSSFTIDALHGSCQNGQGIVPTGFNLNWKEEVCMGKLGVAAMALCVAFGVGTAVTYANEPKAKMEEARGEIKANAEESKAESKALREEAKGNDAKASMERGKGKTKSAGQKSKAKAKELKAKTE
jgi:uncharacterized protein HemX